MHRNQLILLTSIVHAIELGCMQALIWNSVGDAKFESPYNGSPLDHMPCPPSQLLYTYDSASVSEQTREYVRDELEKAELCIKRRSIAVENKWGIDKLKQSSIGLTHVKILAILDILDKHCYDLADVNETIETLYRQIFPKIRIFLKRNDSPKQQDDLNDLILSAENTANLSASSGNASSTANPAGGLTSSNNLNGANENAKSANCKDDANSSINAENTSDSNSSALSDKEIVFLLCDWAITTKRCGLHRIFYVVFLIRKRQLDWITQFKEAKKNVSKFSYSRRVTI